MFITFEGIDGSGKSTQIELLHDRLERHNVPVSVFREPGGTPLSESVRSLLLDDQHDVHPVAEVLLFSAARAQLIAREVLPRLEKGEVVVLDRFYDSTTAYQGYGRESLPIGEIHRINRIASLKRVPDITFYLRISLEEAEARRARQKPDRMEQSGSDFYQKVIKGFDRLAGEESRFVTLEASEGREKLHEDIWHRVASTLRRQGLIQ